MIKIVAEALFSPEQSIELHDTLESVYKETSLRVLNLLKEKYRMLDHLQALRQYLLLGQGDFIRHLLELLAYVYFYKRNVEFSSRILFKLRRGDLLFVNAG